jgi:tetratricopeptide (TPR) repeat protein
MRKRITALFMGATCLVAQAQYEKLEAKVRKALAVDKPYRALALSERATTRQGAPGIFHVLRAEGFNRIGSYTKAMEELRMVPELRGEVEYQANLIGSYTGIGRLDSAEALITGPTDPKTTEEYLYRAGRVLALRQRWPEALAFFDTGLSLYPNSARMVRERGACHAMLGDSVSARIDLDEAVRLAPRDAAGYNSRGYYRYMVFGEYAKALADMDRAIKQDPNYGYAFSNRGWCHYRLGDPHRARRDLVLAVRKNPRNAFAYRSLGIIDLEGGDPVKGCGNLHRALELGFTLTYGTEVEELVRERCATTDPAPAPTPVPDTPAAPPANAPANPAKPRSNAP